MFWAKEIPKSINLEKFKIPYYLQSKQKKKAEKKYY